MARPLQKLKNHLIYYSARVLIFLLGLFPFSLVGRAGETFGALFFRFAGSERKKTLQGLHTAFSPSLSDRQIQALALRAWRGLGRNLFETARWLRMTRQEVVSQVVRREGMEHLEGAIRKGKGVLVVSAHLGNWELLAAFLASEYRASAVAQRLYDPRFDGLVTDLRSRKLGLQIVKRGFALRGILEVLRQNRLVLLLCDQDSGEDGVFVPFFGKEAWTQSGAARIARKTGAALVPAFMTRGTDGRFGFRVGPEIPQARTGEKERDILETVRRYTEAIEAQVKSHPEQWVWMHERWKTRPEGEKPSVPFSRVS